MVSDINKMSRQDLLNCVNNRKNEIAEKLKSGETEEEFMIGASSYTIKEWDNLINKVDKNMEENKEQQEEKRKEQLESLYKESQVKSNYIMDKLNGVYSDNVPYGYLAKDGVIEYNGVVFTCDAGKNAICLGDVTSDKRNVLTIPLSKGGCLMVNRDSIGDLSKAITMFSPEDMNRIMRAIADDNKVQEMQNTIEEETNSIGESAENEVFGQSNQQGEDKSDIL